MIEYIMIGLAIYVVVMSLLLLGLDWRHRRAQIKHLRAWEEVWQQMLERSKARTKDDEAFLRELKRIKEQEGKP